MPSWLIPVLNWILANLPISSIITAVIHVMRGLASKTDTPLDDEAVDFIEMVFIEMGLISKSADSVSVPVTSAKV